MKKLLSVLIILIAMMPLVSATTLDIGLVWDDYSTDVKTITYGDKLEFTADVAGWYPPISVNLQLRDFNDNILVNYFDEEVRNVPGYRFGSWATKKIITENDYLNVGEYEIYLRAVDEKNQERDAIIKFKVVPKYEELTVKATANPVTGNAPLLVNFGCVASGGNAPYEFDWNFGDGHNEQTSSATHLYSQGEYTATCTVIDEDGRTATDSVKITVEEEIPRNNAPNADFTWNPKNPYVNDKVTFDGSLSTDPNNDSLTYSWDISNDGTIDGTGKYFDYSFSQERDYRVRLLVSDGKNSNEIVKTVHVKEKSSNEIKLTKINCFEKIIEKHEQTCDLFVEVNNQKEGNVTIELFKLQTQEYLGRCETDKLSGGCNVQYIENIPGEYTVYAKATKKGFIPDIDTYPRFDYEVLKETFKIEKLKVYKDPKYSIEENTFYRGEDLYVTFEVFDVLGNEVGQNEIKISKATLLSSPGGRAELEEVMNQKNKFYYKLDTIPLTHEFFGDSQVFTFAFDFSNGGGQAKADLTILNNPPTTRGIERQTIYVGETKKLNLDNYFADLEQDLLVYKISSVTNNKFSVALTDRQTLQITGLELGEGYITIIAKDYDGDVINEQFPVIVLQKGDENLPPIAEFEWSPDMPVVGQMITFDATESKDPDGTIIKYEWVIDGVEISTTNPIATLLFGKEGIKPVTLTVTDNEGKSTTTTKYLTVKETQRGGPTAVLNGPVQVYAGDKVLYDASSSNDLETTKLYYIFIIDGTIVKQGYESTLEVTYKSLGEHTVTVKVLDDEENSDSASVKTKVLLKQNQKQENEEESNSEITFHKIRMEGDEHGVVKAGDFLQVTVSADSDDIKGARLSVIVPELGLKVKGRKDNLNGKETLKASIWVPESTPEGYYLARIGLYSDEGVRKGEYRWFKVTK